MLDSTVIDDLGLKWIILKGRIDSITAPDIQAQVKELIAQGERILVANLEDVNYMSSAGLRVLVSSQQQLKKAGGEIILYRASENILELFRMSSFDKIFKILDTREEIQSLFDTTTALENIGTQNINGIALRYTKKQVPPGKLFTIGSQAKLPHAQYAKEDMVTLKANDIQFGTGLASLGANFDECKDFFGEALIIHRHFFFYPAVKRPAVDFMLCSQEDSNLEYQFLHGFGFNGDYATTLSFEGSDGFVELHELIDAFFTISEANKIGIVLLGESKGFWGMHLKQVPIIENQPQNGKEIFDSENFTGWMNFPVEPDAVNNIVAAVGIAVKELETEKSDIQELIAKGGNFHLHGGLFDKEPLSKNHEQFENELQRVLTQLEAFKVQHILGQSRFSSGLAGIIELE